MILISLECSTTTASVALLDDEVEVFFESWREERARHEGLFDIAASLMARHGHEWRDVGMFAVGRGPGAYSGLRVSLLAAQALAAPGGIPVVAVSSMDALALAIMAENNLNSLAMAGDARRNSFWYGFCSRDSLAVRPTEWKVAPNERAPDILGGANVAATPHTSALEGILKATPQTRWLPGPVIPTARHVAHLARLRLSKQADPEPLTPLYLHPAV
jgi:tRNA threonylcarbamoyladenosine biosynthesis protein TsaB